MRPRDWLRSQGLTAAAFARQHQKAASTIYRNCDGVAPDGEGMRFWFLASGGAVQPNDFYPIERWTDELASQNGGASATR